MKGYFSFLGHKEKAVCGYGWWKEGGLGTTLGRVLAGDAGTQLVAYIFDQWDLAMQIKVFKGRYKAAGRDWVCRVCMLVCRVNENTIFPWGGGQMQRRTTQPVSRAPFLPLKTHQHSRRTSQKQDKGHHLIIISRSPYGCHKGCINARSTTHGNPRRKAVSILCLTPWTFTRADSLPRRNILAGISSRFSHDLHKRLVGHWDWKILRRQNLSEWLSLIFLKALPFQPFLLRHNRRT